MHGRATATGILCVLLCLFGCANRAPEQPDRPRLSPNTILRDVIFHSAALNRDMRYRVILPSVIPPNQKLPVVYLLHGNGGGFRDWSNYSDVATYASAGLILVMPQGDDSYYVNAVERPEDRYEDYVVHDLAAEVEARFPVAGGGSNQAIAGVSMGGFGAIKIALSHPDLFVFAGALSPAIDVPRRRFSVRRIEQYRAQSAIFGPWDSPSRRSDDPFLLAKSSNPGSATYLHIACGEGEGLLPANRDFAAILSEEHLQHEFHVVAGGHDWKQWNAQLSSLFQALLSRTGH